MKGRPRYYVESQGPNADAVRLGLAWLAEEARRSGAAEAVLALSTKENVEGTVAEAIGRQQAKALAANRPVFLQIEGTRVPLRLITKRTRLYFQARTPVLCVYLHKSFLDKLDADPDVSAMCVVPWMNEAREWIETWAPAELTGKAAVPPAPTLDPVLEEALRSLTDFVNLATGVIHPSDRSAAIETFRVLRRHQIPFDPEAVRRWLAAEGGWEPRHADDVKDIAQGVIMGHRFRGLERIGANNIIQHWAKRPSGRGHS